MRNMQTKDRLILALDVDSKKEVQRLVCDLKGWVGLFKIGIRLFFRFGPEIVSLVQEAGGRVFLDAKLHDIPSVVGATAQIIGKMNVSMLTLHALGGMEMMRRANQAIKEENPHVKVLGVTILTSLDEKALREELGVKDSPEKETLFLATRAKEAGLDGIVCSGAEVEMVRRYLGSDFTLVVPGIRPGRIEGDEQKRVLTPGEAIRLGADYLVVGRPILQAPDVVKAAREITRAMGRKIWKIKKGI